MPSIAKLVLYVAHNKYYNYMCLHVSTLVWIKVIKSLCATEKLDFAFCFETKPPSRSASLIKVLLACGSTKERNTQVTVQTPPTAVQIQQEVCLLHVPRCNPGWRGSGSN